MTTVRDALVHATCLSKIMKMENRAQTFVDIKNDLNKLNEVVTEHSFKMLSKVTKSVLERAVKCQSTAEIRAVLRPYGRIDKVIMIENSSLFYGKTPEKDEALGELINELYEMIPRLTISEELLFIRIGQIISSSADQNKSRKEKYMLAHVKLAASCQMAEDYYVDSSYEGLIFSMNLTLNDFKNEVMDPEMMSDLMMNLETLIHVIKERLTEEAAGKVAFLLLKISNLIEFDVGKVRAIEELQKTLTKYNGALNDKYKLKPRNRKPIDKVELAKKFYRKKIQELNELVKSTGNKLFQEDENPSKYMDDSELHAAIEGLILDITSVLSDTFNVVSANQMSIEHISPLLLGKSMRNHLAHGNDIVELFIQNPSTSLILNAQQLISFDALNFRLPIGSREFTCAARLKENDERRYSVVSWQQKLNNSLKKGDLKTAMHCIQKGADLAARSLGKMTSIHLAANGSEECLRFVVDNWKGSIDLKDSYGKTPLHIASACGNIECVKFLLLSKEFNVNSTDCAGSTPLHTSASRGHTDVVNILLNSGADQGIANGAGRTPLYSTIFNKHECTSKLLLARADKQVIKRSTFSPLHVAAESGSLEIVDHLLSNDALKDVVTEKLATPLHLASLRGHLDIVKSLIARGANVNAKCHQGSTPLHNAAEKDKDEVVDALLLTGADPDGCGDDNYTALFHAACNGNINIVRLLLERGARVNIHTPDGMSPLHWAALGGHSEVIKLLICMNADVTTQDSRGLSPLHKCAARGHLSAAKLLVKHNAPINIMDFHGRSPIFYAAANGYEELTKLLANFNAYLDIEDCLDLTPLHLSCMRGHVNVAKILIEYGSPINALNDELRTPLHYAAEKGFTDMAALLLTNGADANIRDRRGLLALHVAASFGHKNIVLLLIKSNTDLLDELDSAGYSPLHLACFVGNLDVAQLLIQRGCKMDCYQSNEVPSVLELAIESKNMKIVNLLLKNKFPVDEAHLQTAAYVGFGDFIRIVWKDLPSLPNELVTDLLVTSCMRRQTDVLRALIENGANVNTMLPTEGGSRTLLHMAVQFEYEDIVLTLLESGADVNVKCTHGTIPLHTAVKQSNSAIISDLLDYRSSIDVPKYKGGPPTPLQIAVRKGEYDIVDLLLNHDSTIDINKPNFDRTLLIQSAIFSGSIDTVKLLIERGANIHFYSQIGRATHVAALSGSVEMLDYILSMGMNIDETVEDGFSLLHIGAVASKNRHQLCKYLLVDKSMNPNLINVLGQSALHAVARESKNDVDVAQLLLESGAYYDLKDSSSKMAIDVTTDRPLASLLSTVDNLFKGVKRGDVSVVANAIGQGVVVDAINCHQETPLICAAWKGFADIVDILLSGKANPNVVGKNGSTPLHYACKFSHERIAMSLLSHGAIFDLVNDAGKEPMDYAAKESEVHSICALIKESFASIENGDKSVFRTLLRMEDQPDKHKALFNCRNKDGKSFLTVAILGRSSIGDKLENLCTKLDIIHRTYYLLSTGNVREALDFCQSEKDKIFESYQKHSLLSMKLDITLVKMHYKLQNYQEVIKLSRELHETLKEQLGPDHEKTLQVDSYHALALHQEDRNEEALNILKRVFKQQKQLLKPTHQDLLSTQCHLALVLDKLRKYDEALNLNYDLYEKYKNSYGAKHPLTLVAQNKIAMVLTNQGKLDEALEIYQKVYKARQQVLGPNDRMTLRTKSNIAGVLFKQNKFEEASMEFDETITMQSKLLGNGDRDVLGSKINAFMTLLRQGQHKGASALYQEIVENNKMNAPPRAALYADIFEKSLEFIDEHEQKILLRTDTSLGLEHLEASVGDLPDFSNLLSNFEFIEE